MKRLAVFLILSACAVFAHAQTFTASQGNNYVFADLKGYDTRVIKALPAVLYNEYPAEMARTKSLIFINLLSDLQAAPVDTNSMVLLIGKNTVGDGGGGFYRWDMTSVDAADNTYLNVVKSNLFPSGPGAWVKIFQRIRVYPQGILTINGVKRFYAFSTTDANGNSTINLTTDNTTTGTALFSEIWTGRGGATVYNASSSAMSIAPIYGSPTAVAAGLKTITFNFVQQNTQTLGGTILAIAGLVIQPFKAPTAASAVTVIVDGL